MKEYKYKINGNSYNVTINDIQDNVAVVEVNGTPYNVFLDKPVVSAPKIIKRPAAAPRTESGAPVVSRPVISSSKSAVKSPLPGVVLDILVKEGDTVKAGQTILILEAMKMENNIMADKAGKVTAINVNKGDSVLEGKELIVIE